MKPSNILAALKLLLDEVPSSQYGTPIEKAIAEIETIENSVDVWLPKAMKLNELELNTLMHACRIAQECGAVQLNKIPTCRMFRDRMDTMLSQWNRKTNLKECMGVVEAQIELWRVSKEGSIPWKFDFNRR